MKTNSTPTAFAAAFAVFLREKRQSKSLSMYRLARLSGLSESALRTVESGLHEPRVSTVVALSTALGLKPLDVLRKLL